MNDIFNRSNAIKQDLMPSHSFVKEWLECELSLRRLSKGAAVDASDLSKLYPPARVLYEEALDAVRDVRAGHYTFENLFVDHRAALSVNRNLHLADDSVEQKRLALMCGPMDGSGVKTLAGIATQHGFRHTLFKPYRDNAPYVVIDLRGKTLDDESVCKVYEAVMDHAIWLNLEFADLFFE